MALDRQVFLTALAALAAGCDDLTQKCGSGGSGSTAASCAAHTGGPTTEGYTTPTPTGEGGSYYSGYGYSYSSYSYSGY